ncbi:LPS export ABC transporter permease LptG [Sagittula salina]|uniref:LPS export ABC transporter permease LptG n=1 Tax=Sagittula salina TaxID=2820268 RepID=A0A940MGC6_9RHOB|nr:LPS export ABC transporter permease LptG [Sagittula salina]MBP0481016.1 LPS export ABC transporter permease LptG [Sagittula salina]
MKLHLYFARRFLWFFFGILTIFGLFQGLLDLVEEMRHAGDDMTLGQTVALVGLKLPEGLYEVMPLVMILATVAMFLGLARSSELVATRAAGRSGLTALASPVAVAFAIGLIIVAVMNPIVAGTSKRYADLRETWKSGNTSALSLGPEGLWLRQGGEDGQSVITATRANPEATELYDVSIVVYAPEGGPKTRILAASASLEEGAWILTDAKAWPLESGLSPELGARLHPRYELPSTLTRESIRDRFGRPSAVPIWDLPRFISGLDEAGFSARRHVVWYNMELARPLFFVAMVLVGAAFTMQPTRLGRTGLAVLSAVMLGFGLYYVRSFAQIMGENGQLAPVLAAWVPPTASVLLALGLVLHMEDG